MRLERGQRYRVLIQLSGLEAAFASPEDVRRAIWDDLGIDSDVRELGGGRFEAVGTWVHASRDVEPPEVVESIEPVSAGPRVTIGQAVIHDDGDEEAEELAEPVAAVPPDVGGLLVALVVIGVAIWATKGG